MSTQSDVESREAAGDADMSCNQKIERALNRALACRQDSQRAEEALAAAVEHLQTLVRGVGLREEQS